MNEPEAIYQGAMEMIYTGDDTSLRSTAAGRQFLADMLRDERRSFPFTLRRASRRMAERARRKVEDIAIKRILDADNEETP